MSYPMQIAESTPSSSVLLNAEKSIHNIVDTQHAFSSSDAQDMLGWLVSKTTGKIRVVYKLWALFTGTATHGNCNCTVNTGNLGRYWLQHCFNIPVYRKP